jgi:hypothetical protein
MNALCVALLVSIQALAATFQSLVADGSSAVKLDFDKDGQNELLVMRKSTKTFEYYAQNADGELVLIAQNKRLLAGLSKEQMEEVQPLTNGDMAVFRLNPDSSESIEIMFVHTPAGLFSSPTLRVYQVTFSEKNLETGDYKDKIFNLKRGTKALDTGTRVKPHLIANHVYHGAHLIRRWGGASTFEEFSLPNPRDLD